MRNYYYRSKGTEFFKIDRHIHSPQRATSTGPTLVGVSNEKEWSKYI